LSQPEYFLKEKNSIELQQEKEDPFWILYINSKYAFPGAQLVVFGYGFEDDRITYDFKIGERGIILNHQKIDNLSVRIDIPSYISLGTYDIYAPTV
jgi:hypothetical protein